MRLLVLLCVFSMQFSFSQESKSTDLSELKGRELAKRRSQIYDSLTIKFDSIANDSVIKEKFVLEKANETLGPYFYRVYPKYSFGNFVDLKRVLESIGYDFLHASIDEKIKGELLYVFYKGNLKSVEGIKVFEKKLFEKLKLEKIVKLENYKTYNVSIINSLLIKSTERDYKNVFDREENRLYFSGKIKQFINALNGFFPGKIFLVENSDEENLYDINIDVSSLDKCLEEIKFLGFVIEENNEMLNHTYFKVKSK
ncbi:MAG: hypothetical protein V4666_09070 [Bacteroidota bacterium]